ncbi:hypothetical protein B0H14DRAFT_2779815, partial [Mycena olivaceomarginata]
SHPHGTGGPVLYALLYTGNFSSVFASISSQFPASQYSMRAALFNIGYGVWKPFLEVTPEEVQESLDTNIDAQNPTRGTLIFTGATASMRGNTRTSAFSIGKFGARALSQSLAKEFGKDDIHAIIDGRKNLTGAALARAGDNPPSGLSPDSIAQSYLYLANQEKSAWTWELDLRPAHERW